MTSFDFAYIVEDDPAGFKSGNQSSGTGANVWATTMADL